MPLNVERILDPVDLRDASGRFWNQERATRILSPNPIPDRQGIPTNLEAMKEYVHNKDEVADVVGFFREGFSDNDLNLGELWELACTVHRLPLYLSLRANLPIGEENLPPVLVDASRVTAGIVAVTHSMLSEFMPSTPTSPDTLYEYATGKNPDQINYFISDDGEDSCPAPKHAVLKILDLLIIPVGDDTPRTIPFLGLLDKKDIQGARDFALYHQLFFNYVQGLEDTLPIGDKEVNVVNERIRSLFAELSSSLGYED